MGSLLSRAVRRGTRGHIRHLAPVDPATAPAAVRRVFAQMEQDFGLLAPPISLHAAAPDTLAGAWMMLRETLLAAGSAPRAAKEAVAVAVSRANACPYCVAVHGTALHGLLPGREADAISAGRAGPRASDNPATLLEHPRAGAEPAYRAELLGTAVTFHYLNRMVNIFLVESPLPATAPTVTRLISRVAGTMLRPMLRRQLVPGRALELLPAASPARDLGWAADHPTLADAFGRAATAVDAAGERSLPAAVRTLVAEELAAWDGRPPPPGSGASWRLAALPEVARPAARLALLAAVASFQVGDSVIQSFRQYRADDRSLVEAASWASLEAAKWWAARWSRQAPPGRSGAGPQ